MDFVLLGAVYGIPLLVHTAAASYAYYDAKRHGMDATKWGAVAFFVPMFGFFAYLFERDERTHDESDRDEMFVDGPFQIHKSRAEDAPFTNSDDSTLEDEE
jgi:hypothetical protein